MIQLCVGKQGVPKLGRKKPPKPAVIFIVGDTRSV